jgi:hypothetical protein
LSGLGRRKAPSHAPSGVTIFPNSVGARVIIV